MILDNKERNSEVINPFIEIPKSLHFGIVLYLIVFIFFPPVFKTFSNEVLYPYTYERLFLRMLWLTLLYAPVIFYNKNKFGLLHPLIFVPLLTLSLSTLKSSQSLFNIFNDAPYFSFMYVKPLEGWTQRDLAAADLYDASMELVALMMYYLGFFFFKNMKVPTFKKTPPVNLKVKMLFLIVISFVVFFAFMQMKGGIYNHFVSFGKGRANSMKGYGWLVALTQIGVVALYVWYLYDRYVMKSTLFKLLLLISLPVNFFTAGSRSTIVVIVINFVLIWIYHNKKIPLVLFMVLAYGGIITMGILGQLRNSTFQNTVDWSVVTDVDFTNAKKSFSEEAQYRSNENPDLAIIGAGLPKYGLLWGQTYVCAILFWVPRGLWDGKTRSAGYYVGTWLFNSVGAIPPGHVAESYWNFSWPGVIIIGFLFGLTHRWFSEFYLGNQELPFAYLIYVTFLILFKGGGQSAVFFIQWLMLAILAFKWLKLIKK